MAKIYKTTDVIRLKIDDIEIGVSPLTFEQKMQVQSEMLKGDQQAAMRAAKLACQYAMKSVKGIETQDGQEYNVEIQNGIMTDQCWDDLQNIEQTQQMVTVCLALINGVPEEFTDPESGKKLEGVSVIREATKGKKK